MAKARKVEVVAGVGTVPRSASRRSRADRRHGQEKTGAKKVVKFEQAIIAAGSQVVRLPFIPDDPRVMDSTGALELASIPKRMLVIGGGIIGLEMATVYSTLGARLDVVEMLDGLMPGADRDLVRVWEKVQQAALRPDHAVKTKTDGRRTRSPMRLRVTFEGAQGAEGAAALRLGAGERSGARPNGKKIAADKAGVAVTDRGLHPGRQPDAHERAAHLRDRRHRRPADARAQGDARGHVAAEAAAGEKSFFDARVIPSVAYTDPEIAWVGVTEDEAKAKGDQDREGSSSPGPRRAARSPTAATRASPSCCSTPTTHRIVGGGIVGTHAGDLISEIALAIEMGADAADIGRTIHPHPTLSESVGLAAEAFEGVCTDLPPPRKK